MKVATSGYQTNLFASPELVFVDIVTITFADGTVIRFSLLDQDVRYGGHTFTTTGPYVERGTRKQARGVQADTLELTVFAGPSQLIDLGLPLLQAVVAGLANGAIVELDRGINPTVNPDGTLTITEAVIVFRGLITDTKTGRTGTVITVSDFRWLLNSKWPRDVFQPSCRWTWGDSGCTISRASYSVTGVVQTGANTSLRVMMPSVVIPSGVPNGGQTAPSGYFDLGVLQFTSGRNVGLQRQVQTFLGSGAQASYEQVVVNDKPAGFYYLNETSGTSIIDYSGKGRNGTYHGGITFNQTGGLVGDPKTAIKFDGSSAYLTLPQPNPQNVSPKGNAFSLEFFMKLNAGASTQPQGLLDTAPQKPDTLWNISSQPIGGISQPVFAWRFFPTVTIPSTSQVWRHLVIVFRGHRSIDYYENGSLVNSVSQSNANDYAWQNPIVVGRVWQGGPSPKPFTAHYYDAFLQMLAIYDYALSPDQPALHYAASQNSPATLTGQALLTHALPYVPLPGESFTMYPGCDKTMKTCDNKFNNIINYAGEPFVPIPETAL